MISQDKLELCVWKYMTLKTEKQYIEGRLRHCQLYCDGLQIYCNAYEPQGILKKEKGLNDKLK